MSYEVFTVDKIPPLTLDANVDMHVIKSSTGATVSLDKGSICSAATRQTLNNKISTEAELVGVDDLIPMIIWTRYFLEAQGYKVTDNVVYQDNNNTTLLAKNGKDSSGKKTKHIHIRYFFVTDRIGSNELTVEYYPTGEILGDFFTKPVQGSLFIKFRKHILNLEHDDLSAYSPGRSHECAGLNKVVPEDGRMEGRHG